MNDDQYIVETNKYSHAGSGASRIDSRHDSLPDAIDAAESLWSLGCQRFVFVKRGRSVYFASGRYFENGDGREGYSTPKGETVRPESFGSAITA